MREISSLYSSGVVPPPLFAPYLPEPPSVPPPNYPVTMPTPAANAYDPTFTTAPATSATSSLSSFPLDHGASLSSPGTSQARLYSSLAQDGRPGQQVQQV